MSEATDGMVALDSFTSIGASLGLRVRSCRKRAKRVARKVGEDGDRSGKTVGGSSSNSTLGTEEVSSREVGGKKRNTHKSADLENRKPTENHTRMT